MMMTTPPKIIETALQRGRIKLLQPEKGFHAGFDTVFLSAAPVLKPHDKILDAGCGIGSAGLCLFLREKSIHLTGVDIQQELIDLAHHNARMNEVSESCRFFAADIATEKVIEDNFFDHVIINPPYLRGESHMASPNKIKAIANGESAYGVTIKDWVKYAHRKLKQGKSLSMIHRADRLDEIVSVMTARRWFGSLVIYPLIPRAGDDAKRVIVTARKERYAPTRLMHGMVIHKSDGSYTADAAKVLEKSAALFSDGY
jgi:tRNA1(Val) A37 N6-methylase TrmN6